MSLHNFDANGNYQSTEDLGVFSFVTSMFSTDKTVTGPAKHLQNFLLVLVGNLWATTCHRGLGVTLTKNIVIGKKPSDEMIAPVSGPITS
jgi:hypothetical protein